MDNLPRYFVLESLSNNKYLRFVHEDVSLHGHLDFSGEEAISPYAKYEFEPVTKEANKGLFNIRCCFNNKYWTRREEGSASITATADEPVEDPLKWRCTMFKPSLQVFDKKPMLRLQQVQYWRNATVFIGDGSDRKYASCLNMDANVPVLQGDSHTMFHIIDFETFVILPKRVMFKGDNGLYLYSIGFDFTSAEPSGIGSLAAETEVMYTRDGRLRLKSSGRYFWRARESDMQLYSAENAEDDYSLFSLYKSSHGVNEVALWNVAQRVFFVRKAIDNSYSGRYTINKQAVLRVEEPVLWRSIYNVDFRLNNARIYNRSAVLLVSRRFSNPLQVDKVVNLTETITKETTRSWKSNVSLQLGTPTTIETDIPLIVDGGEVGLWDAFNGPYEWRADVKGSQTLGISEDITIPANSSVVVDVIATRGTCDVPFTYVQRDGLPIGNVTINKMDDGVYTGINYYNVKTRVVQISS